MTSAHRRRHGRRIGAAAGLVAAAAVVASGGAAATAASAPAPVPSNWRHYLVQPTSSAVTPVKVTALSGDVSGGMGGAGHSITLRTGGSGMPATILLDYGREVLGTPNIDVKSFSPTSGATSSVALAFSESKQYMRSPGSSTLADAASAGDTSLTVQPGGRRHPLTFAVGDTVVVGGSSGETDTITAVADSTLTLANPLRHDDPVGTSVTSTPGAVTGDSAFSPRAESITVDSASTLTGTFQGGFRFEAITLTTPGTLELSGAGLDYTDGGVLFQAKDYQGFFVSSSDAFNKMYYDGAYTAQTNLEPAGPGGATAPAVLDGSKRDRAIWSGDLKISGQNIADTLGSNGNAYLKESLLTLIHATTRGDGLHADTLFGNHPYSNSYSHWTLDAATDYYRNTGDRAFIEHVLPWLEGQLSYDATLTNSDGLLVTGDRISRTNGGYDWDYYDGAKTGVVTAFNLLYYKALGDLAYIERSLGHDAKATAYEQTAEQVKSAINAHLLDAATGTYYLSESDHSTFAQDANSLAIVFGVAPANEESTISAALKQLWGQHGAEPYSSGSPYSDLISPFVTAFEVEAHYKAGDAAGAERLLHLTWDQMTSTSNPFYTGTFWENYAPDGTPDQSRTSLSHGWASGPTPIMTSYVLGVTPIKPGYRTFSVSPHFGSLLWAKGGIPTPHGRIGVSWQRTGNSYHLTVQVPAGTTAYVNDGSGSPVVVKGGDAGASRTVTR